MALTVTIQPTSLSPEGRCATRAMDGAPCVARNTRSSGPDEEPSSLVAGRGVSLSRI